MFESFREEGPGRDLPAAGPDLARRLADDTAAATFPPACAWWDTDPSDEDPDRSAGLAAGLAAEDASIERTAGWERLVAHGQAAEMLEIDAAVRRAVDRAESAPPHAHDAFPGDAGAAIESLTAEYALRWRVHNRTATKRVDEAVTLAGIARPALDAMLDGRIALAHTRALADAVLGLAPHIARQVIETVLAGGVLRTPGDMSRAARRDALRRDPDHAARRTRNAHRERDVTLHADGMATLSAYLPAAEALALYRTVQAHAQRVPAHHPAHDPADPDSGQRSIGARRADALTDLVAAGALIAAGLVPDTPDTGQRPDPEPRGNQTAEPDETAAHEPGSDQPGGEHPSLGALLADEDAWLHDALADDPHTWADTETTLDADLDADLEDAYLDHWDGTDPELADAPLTENGSSADTPRPTTEGPPPEPDSASSNGFWAAARPPKPAPPPPLPAARRVEVRVVVSADTLLGLDDHPAELPGYGPITADHARRLAADNDAVLRRILTDPASGTVLDVGTTRYRPPPSLAGHVRDRDLYCGFPGCRMPATACDLDHIVAFHPETDTGPTAACNLGPACRHHHRVKGMPGWTVRRDPDGTLLWTTPTGRHFRTLRTPLLPIDTTRPAPTTRRPQPAAEHDDCPAAPADPVPAAA